MGTITVAQDICKGCELCVSSCPLRIMAMSPDVNRMGYHTPRRLDEKRCNACRVCAWMCPDAVIEVYRT